MSKQDGINRETSLSGELQIGPTSAGMVRLYVRGQGVDLPMDFMPDEAREIADELTAAAEEAEGKSAGQGKRGKKSSRR